MIEIKPDFYNGFICPECGNKDINVTGILFPGIHVLGDCYCILCGLKFLADFPIGHSLFFNVIIGKENLKIYGKEESNWFHHALLNSYKNQNIRSLKIEKKVYEKNKNVILLNCIDYLYGHVLLKLFNAQLYIEKYKDLGLIIIIPKNFEWLVPEGAAEVWLVDIKLSEARGWFVEFDSFIKNELLRFEKVFLSLAYSHPDFSKIDISKFIKIKKFNIDNFDTEPITITFISREDRFWVSSKIELFFFYLFRKLNLLGITKQYFIFKQNHKISSLYKNIKKKIPNIKFYVVGISQGGKFVNAIEDNRVKDISENTELEWCKIYSESNIVIGIHGSNMLLPSALAGAVIEILPGSRIGNVTQDIAAYYPGVMLLYFCRFVHEFIRPKEIAANVLSMINGYKYFITNSDAEKCRKLLNNYRNSYNK